MPTDDTVQLLATRIVELENEVKRLRENPMKHLQGWRWRVFLTMTMFGAFFGLMAYFGPMFGHGPMFVEAWSVKATADVETTGIKFYDLGDRDKDLGSIDSRSPSIRLDGKEGRGSIYVDPNGIRLENKDGVLELKRDSQGAYWGYRPTSAVLPNPNYMRVNLYPATVDRPAGQFQILSRGATAECLFGRDGDNSSTPKWTMTGNK